MRLGRIAAVLAMALIGAACAGADDDATTDADSADSSAPTPQVAPPSTPDRAATEATAAFDRLIDEVVAGSFDTADVTEFSSNADARHAWLLSDLLRFVGDPVIVDTIVGEFDELTGTDLAGQVTQFTAWNETTNRLIAWDTPAPPDYRRLKGRLFTLVEPRWAPFFDDADATIDWRWLSWGGVSIDDRPLGTTTPCPAPGCIPSLDDPTLVAAADGGYYDDHSIVFGVVQGDEAVAFPRNVMEIHEMVNITIGDRRMGIPYCTLCGSAQAFYTDSVPAGIDTPVLRTSGLLSRSNKVMFDLLTMSAFDTFTGEAVSGPLLRSGVVLDQATVTVTTWGEWKAAHPHTRIVAEDGGIGRDYPDDPLQGRDDDGPIFPIGDADPRLPVQAAVVGVVLDDGTAVAFSVEALDEAASTQPEGAQVARLGSVAIVSTAGGYSAMDDDEPVAAHQAFWFAWSQFHP
ncbi:MAG: DUF3179 domain-containing protein, partial [Acidimicrobiales bacterium]|nr:DUF3179 domain-containing protein [Acidimicrobiales bacterium]